MPTQGAVSPHYAGRFLGTLLASFAQLIRSPSHSRRAEAGRRAARHMLWLIVGIGAAIIALMYVLDAAEIQMMPKRGTPSLWWVRILTDFGKSEYVLWTLFGLMAVVLVASAAMRGTARALLLGLGTRLQFLFMAAAGRMARALHWRCGAPTYTFAIAHRRMAAAGSRDSTARTARCGERVTRPVWAATAA